MMHDNPISVGGGHPVDDTAPPVRKPSSAVGRIVVFGVMAAAVVGLFLLYRTRTKAAASGINRFMSGLLWLGRGWS